MGNSINIKIFLVALFFMAQMVSTVEAKMDEATLRAHFMRIREIVLSKYQLSIPYKF